ncbi:hypothetical protein IAT38_003354 [Cryptococcus sp. DSM 104549]
MLAPLLLLPTLLLALLLYALHLLSLSLPQRFTLPTHALTQPPTSNGKPSLLPSPFDNSQWTLTRSPPFSYALSTPSLNAVPQAILGRLPFRAATRLKRSYDLAVGVALLGSSAAVIGAVWAAWGVWAEVWAELAGHAAVAAGEAAAEAGEKVVKRAVEEVVVRGYEGGSGGGLQPLIPGITVPLSHFPALAFALIANQLMHELGHALSAALDDVQPSKMSLNLYYFIPSMTIEFPPSVDRLDPNSKMRLASSGPFHNLLTWFVLWLLATSRLGGVFWSDKALEGRVVQEVQWTSPLYAHLTPGDLITHLDDHFIGSPLTRDLSLDAWSAYLSSSVPDDTSRGWCINKSTFLALPSTPCRPSPSGENSIPFISSDKDTPAERCLTPHPILDIPSKACPCPDHRWVCVRPESPSILRIRVKSGGVDRVVLWDGPRDAVLAEVKVGGESARGWEGGVRTSVLILHYLSTIAFSLFIFNLLPLPSTDGSQLFAALLTWRSTQRPISSRPMKATLSQALSAPTIPSGPGVSGVSPGGTTPSINPYREYELDSEDEEGGVGLVGARGGGEEGTGKKKEDVWRRRVRVGVEWGVAGVCGAWVVGWAMLGLLRSS